MDQLTSLIAHRSYLTSLRRNEIKQAIGCMELALDCLVISILTDARNCDASVQALIRGEFKRLQAYRNEHREDVASYLEGLTEDERRQFYERRAKVDKILDN